jgi:hypothetical protein
MPSNLPTDASESFVLLRQALWAGDHEGAFEYLTSAEAAIASRRSRRMYDYASLEDIIAADIEKIRTDLLSLIARADEGEKSSRNVQENPCISAGALRGVVFGDGFGQFTMRAYLTRLDLEKEFREAVDRTIPVSDGVVPVVKQQTDDPSAEQMDAEQDESSELADPSRSWFDVSGPPKVFVHVGEFPLITARCSWCPAPKDAEAVRQRFRDVLKTIDLFGDKDVPKK